MKIGRPKLKLKINNKDIKTSDLDLVPVYRGGAKRLINLAQKHGYFSRIQMLKEWEANGDLICEIIKEKGVRLEK